MRTTAWVNCTSCDGEIEVEAEVTSGEEPVYYPNDRAHPGCPPTVEIVGELRRSGCECEDVGWDRIEEDAYEQILEEAAEQEREWEEYAAEMRMEAMREREMERELRRAS